MVNGWTRLWDGPNRRWRAEGRAVEAIAAPNLRSFSRPPASVQRHAPRLLFVNQYYWPDHASTAQHLTDLAESLAEIGYDCHVVCSRGGYRPDQPRQSVLEMRNGVTIHRVGASAFGRRNSLARMVDYLSFYALALLHCLLLRRFDVVVTLTTPPMIGLVGTLLRRLYGSKHIYWSMDLHPDASVALGRMSARNPVVAALSALSNLVYRRADKVVVLGPYMADRAAAKGVRPDRLQTIPVWSRRDEVYPLPREGHPLRARLGLQGTFVAMYSGNLGLAHTFDEFLEASRRLRDRRDIAFVFVGDGPRLAEVQAAKARDGLDNIRLLDYVPRDQLYASLTLADVHLISMRREMTGLVVPGKLYGAMASGRPLLFVGPEHCESADAIRQAGCGATVRLGDVDGLVEMITHLAADPDLAGQMGSRGRAAFLTEFDKTVCCDSWSNLLIELVGAPRAARPTPAFTSRWLRSNGGSGQTIDQYGPQRLVPAIAAAFRNGMPTLHNEGGPS
jgi:putative colanic acid biosynthesis glycosyltransferase WcaI